MSRPKALASIAFLASLCQGQTQAQSLDIAAIGIHAASVHAPKLDYQNNDNWGFYIKTNAGLTLGAFHNTYSRPSFYGAYQWKAWGPVDLALGAATGYAACSICPMAAAIITLGKVDKASAKLIVSRGTDAFVANLTFEFDLR